MAVKIGKVPPGQEKHGSHPNAVSVTWIGDGQVSASFLSEDGERRHKMEFTYEKMSPDWQDRQKGREKEFSELFNALKREGLFSRDNGKERKRVYFPAANRQLETLTFSYHCRYDDSIALIGGDIVGSQVHKGKTRLKQGNADFVVADAFHVPFENGSLDAIVDIAGATWYALEPYSPGKSSRDNFKSLLHEWHRALAPKGAVVLDDYVGTSNIRLSTMKWLEETCPDIFENVKKGGFYFPVGDYRVAFKARAVKLKTGQAYVFEKV